MPIGISNALTSVFYRSPIGALMRDIGMPAFANRNLTKLRKINTHTGTQQHEFSSRVHTNVALIVWWSFMAQVVSRICLIEDPSDHGSLAVITWERDSRQSEYQLRREQGTSSFQLYETRVS